MKIDWQKYEVCDGDKFKLSKMSTASGLEKPGSDALKQMLKDDIEEIGDLQYRLYAENRQALLIVLQGMDSAGKDGTIRHLMSGLNPQGLFVYSFKHPSTAELEHNFLWRYTQSLPAKGNMVIFNRSHYENVLISRVHPEIVLSERIPGIVTRDDVTKTFWKERYKQLCSFESTMQQGGTQILKFFLHLSKEEQRKRFLSRIDNREKHWKFSSNDIIERDFWDDYQDAYEHAIAHTSSSDAPWYVVPADDKWFAHLLIGKIVLEKMRKMNPQFPEIAEDEKAFMKKARVKLEKEAR